MEAAFDTLAYAERLKAAGMEPSQANAHADALRIAFSEGVATRADIRELRVDMTGLANRIDNIDKNMVTKLDLARVDKRIEVLDKRMDGFEENMATKTDVARVEGRIEVLGKRIDNIDENMATKTELARLETQLQRSINRVVFAMVGTAIALAAAIIAAIGLMM